MKNFIKSIMNLMSGSMYFGCYGALAIGILIFLAVAVVLIRTILGLLN